MKIFIIGGTSGIGLATAIQYLEAGHRVGICGRDIQKVKLNKDYPLLQLYQLDVYDKDALNKAITDFAGDVLDIMIYSAGNYSDSSLNKLSYEDSTNMLRVNIAGAVNALEVTRDIMYRQQRGHIAIIASVSGLLDYPKATIYGKTKRALIQIADAYRRALSDFGINITVIAPGYVNSDKLRELNDHDLSKKPFVVGCEYAATKIIEGIEKNKEIVIFPSRMKYLIRLLSCLPKSLIGFVMYKKAKWSQKK
ncbi:short-subunit dehydrogenase [Dysgonomonas sp. PFB1-18]|uniref:SDR family NAD(P)-dependent oxidoreductase n=1 Tax=unclassified Dysgonomonas TaxID=2630389 RepID=UPI0024730A94|nr:MULTISPECIES: SDR family NAD(P)-dependent oxidoreductase [unclassified Dysgonomonas]MDH6310518.1 short-subunit dehydrogenase [Dysgonomonas sp. PF1-14]MDH6340368.1 short-subunit dehydrogenase [Dysgonomonas sp. PF1-16]MDH6382052.1 short-subunit dehydrogenase [Dysgonomonas sp. PFB1-18]MDH6399339.1 short-subunit dehydrogenase [Dysgonomonas sp. PF1-23]